MDNAKFEMLGPDFDAVGRKLVAAAAPCSLAQTLLLRRRTLADEGILALMGANRLRVVFNVLLTGKILQLAPEVCHLARQDLFGAFLPAVAADYPETDREDDRSTLAHGFFQARVTELYEAGGGGNDNPPDPGRLFGEEVKPSLLRLEIPPLETSCEESPGFSACLTDLNRRVASCDLSDLLQLRHACLQDDEISGVLHPNLLRILFNVWMTCKIQQMDDGAIAAARARAFEDLLPSGEVVADKAVDRQTLNYAFAQARITELSAAALSKAQLDVPPAYLASGKVNEPDAVSPEKPPKDLKSVFEGCFKGLLKEDLAARLGWMTVRDEERHFILTDRFVEIFISQLLPKAVFPHLTRDIAVLAGEFESHGKKVGLSPRKMADAGRGEKAVRKYLSGDGRLAFEGLLAKLAVLVREYPLQREKARKTLAELKSAEENRGTLSKLFGGGDKDAKRKSRKAGIYISLEEAIQNAGTELGCVQTACLEEREFNLLADLLEGIEPRRTEELFGMVEDVVFRNGGDTLAGNEVTDSLCKIFRDEAVPSLDIGLIFSRLIYQHYPFNLEHFDAFFQNNARFSKEKVIGAYPYFRTALAWELSNQAHELAELADQDREDKFDEHVPGYRISRRAAMVMEMRKIADKIATDLSSHETALADEARNRYWQDVKLSEFRPA